MLPSSVTMRNPPMWRRATSMLSTISVSRTALTTAASIDSSYSSSSEAKPTTPGCRATISALPCGRRVVSLLSGRKVALPARLLRSQVMHLSATSSLETTMLFMPPPIA